MQKPVPDYLKSRLSPEMELHLVPGKVHLFQHYGELKLPRPVRQVIGYASNEVRQVFDIELGNTGSDRTLTEQGDALKRMSEIGEEQYRAEHNRALDRTLTFKGIVYPSSAIEGLSWRKPVAGIDLGRSLANQSSVWSLNPNYPFERTSTPPVDYVTETYARVKWDEFPGQLSKYWLDQLLVSDELLLWEGDVALAKKPQEHEISGTIDTIAFILAAESSGKNIGVIILDSSK